MGARRQGLKCLASLYLPAFKKHHARPGLPWSCPCCQRCGAGRGVPGQALFGAGSWRGPGLLLPRGIGVDQQLCYHRLQWQTEGFVFSEALGLLMQSTDGKQGTAGAGDVPACTTSPLTVWEQHLVGLGRQRVGEAQGHCVEVTGEVGAAEPVGLQAGPGMLFFLTTAQSVQGLGFIQACLNKGDLSFLKQHI